MVERIAPKTKTAWLCPKLSEVNIQLLPKVWFKITCPTPTNAFGMETRLYRVLIMVPSRRNFLHLPFSYNTSCVTPFSLLQAEKNTTPFTSQAYKHSSFPYTSSSDTQSRSNPCHLHYPQHSPSKIEQEETSVDAPRWKLVDRLVDV